MKVGGDYEGRHIAYPPCPWEAVPGREGGMHGMGEDIGDADGSPPARQQRGPGWPPWQQRGRPGRPRRPRRPWRHPERPRGRGKNRARRDGNDDVPIKTLFEFDCQNRILLRLSDQFRLLIAVSMVATGSGIGG